MKTEPPRKNCGEVSRDVSRDAGEGGSEEVFTGVNCHLSSHLTCVRTELACDVLSGMACAFELFHAPLHLNFVNVVGYL